MTVIDVDSHFMEPFDWLERRFPELADTFPPSDLGTVLLNFFAGDMVASLPPSQRPKPIDLIPEGMRPLVEPLLGLSPSALQQMLDGPMFESLKARGAVDAEERLAYMDEEGVDIQFVLPTIGYFRWSAMRRQNLEKSLEALVAYNTWSTEQLAGHTDRLFPVAMVDLTDLGWSLRELERTSEAGGRGFVFSPAGPVDGKSLAHPDFDPLWRIAAERRLLPIIHIGSGRAHVDPGWDETGGSGGNLVVHATQAHLVAETALTALIAGGVFERFPDLTVLVAELGVNWVAPWLERFDAVLDNGILQMSGGWKQALRPSEYVRRNVRFTPLDGASAAAAMRDAGADLFVFSSDYPHSEGPGGLAVGHYREALAGVVSDRELRGFLGETIARDLGITVPARSG